MSRLSRKDIVQVGIIPKNHRLTQILEPETTWVWLENYKKHCDTADNVKSASAANDHLVCELGRTKYKVYRIGTNAANQPEKVLTSDNSYISVKVRDNVFAYVWDKPAIKIAIAKIVAKVMEDEEHPYENELENCLYIMRRFVELCLEDKKSFPDRSLVVRLNNLPTHKETFMVPSYAPVKGYWFSSPVFKQQFFHGCGYKLLTYINNEKTEKCHQFLELDEENRRTGIFGSGEMQFKWEPTDLPIFLRELFTSEDKQPTSRFVLTECRWEILTTPHRPTVELLWVGHSTDLEKPLTALKRDAFKEELVMKVFHPDRVARLMGDTWGTDESWLAQI